MIDLRPTVFEAQVTDIVKHLVAALTS